MLGSQAATLAFVAVGSLSAIIWDILSNIALDFYILCNFSVSTTIVVYFVSRFASLVAFVLVSILSTQSMENCSRMTEVLSWMMAASLSSTTLLFFLRLRGIYADKPYVIAFFFMSWIAIVVGCIVGTRSKSEMRGENGGFVNHGYCISGPIDLFPLITAMSTIPMINDTLTFAAITWRLVRMSEHDNSDLRKSLSTLVLGRYLPALSRALLKDGQVYFLSTVTLSFLSTTLYYVEGSPHTFSAGLVFPNIALMNLMGCRIFRNTKIGLRALVDNSEDTNYVSQPIAFRSNTVNTVSSPTRVSEA
ncbi:hypothetical protein JR316_0011305 [Psilocybe cubensis]|uniref:Uncharacterized protein n=2 Tax=Psilocybe cubensis TaxID=181762 RepID=A0A8H7XUB0_PSICU|nr:hypothetical protein JR316_0011305 [Psilocybe cubensis]KAH9475746.1 hypothetical protein JR316_0011305 [Psilocybe cubensis]